MASTLAVVGYVQLSSANDRIEELEAAEGQGEGGDQGEQGDGGIFGDVEDLFEDLLGETEGVFGEGGGLGTSLECIGSPFGGSGEAATEVGAIARQVEEIRELEFEQQVRPKFLGDDEMNSRVREVFLEEYTPSIAEIEQRILSALGAIPPSTNLLDLRANAIGQQVAGFYEPESGELVVRQSGSEPSAIDRITLAHELDHALTDQALGIPLPDDPDVAAQDSSLAALALVEGDATLVMQRYALTLGFDEQLELLDPEEIARAEAGLAGFPPYLEQELLFPYEQGLNFVCELYAEGGWELVNRAYREPPGTSAEILFPQRYIEGFESQAPPDLPSLRAGWERHIELELGAANLLWLFSAPGGEESRALESAREAAGAWAGGELVLYRRGQQTALGISLAELPGEERLCESMQGWYSAAFDGDRERTGPGGSFEADGQRQDATLTCTADAVALGIGPDLGTAHRLSG